MSDPTVVLTAAAGGLQLPRCENGTCGRPTRDRWCCWTCGVAADGGWQLKPWDAAALWTDVHTRDCEDEARARDPAWYAAPHRAGQPAPPEVPPLRVAE